MISEVQIQLVVDMARKMEAEDKPISFPAIKEAIFKKYHEAYSPFLLRNLYEAEKDNPLYKPKELPTAYVDTKKLIEE
jgi:hypothetical protein